MTKEQRTDVKVGLTVLVALALLLGGIAWGKHWRFGADPGSASAIFPTAGGIEPGDPVMIDGVKRGVVSTVEPQQSGVIVRMSFSVQPDLRKDASAAIAMLELMSGKKVDLVAGRSPDRLPPGTLIPGVYSGDISSLVGMLTSMSSTIDSLTGRADILFASLNSMLSGDSMKNKLNRTLDLAGSSLSTIGTVADRLNQTLIEDGPGIRRTVEQADVATRELSQALQENRPGIRMFIDSGGRAIAEARVALARANTLAIKLDSMISGGGREGTLLYKLMKDPQFAGKLDSVATSLLKLTEQLRLQGLDANIRFWSSGKPAK